MHIIKRIACLILGLACIGVGRGEVVEIDRIVAVVDDDVVTTSELYERVAMIRERLAANQMEAPPDDILTVQVLERLIVENIQLQMGKRAGVRIGDEELTDAIKQFAGQSGLSLAEFQQKLLEQGADYRDFRDQVRKDITIQRVQQDLVLRRIYIPPQELQDFLHSEAGRRETSAEYRVGHILIAVSSRVSDAAARQAEAKAWKLYRDLQEGADFGQTAVAHSDSSHALEGGDLGWRNVTELSSLFADRIVGLKVGEVLEPIRSPSGFHIVGLLDVRGLGARQQEVTEVNVRHILVRPNEIRSLEQGKVLIEKVRARIMAGADFADLARAHSDDPGSALVGGELGWGTPETMAPEFGERMQNLPVGQLSEPFRTAFGWHIVEVLGRRQQDVSEEMRRREAMRLLRLQRFDEELQVFLGEIRSAAYVDIRL